MVMTAVISLSIYLFGKQYHIYLNVGIDANCNITICCFCSIILDMQTLKPCTANCNKQRLQKDTMCMIYVYTSFQCINDFEKSLIYGHVRPSKHHTHAD